MFSVTYYLTSLLFVRDIERTKKFSNVEYNFPFKPHHIDAYTLTMCLHLYLLLFKLLPDFVRQIDIINNNKWRQTNVPIHLHNNLYADLKRP